MFLLDTVVLSELRKANRHPGVVAWFKERHDEELFISALTIGEIRRGICQQEKIDLAFAGRLSTWLDSILHLYGNRILPITTAIAIEWGNISAKVGNSGADNLIAATAKIHRLTVITRNIKHFAATGVDFQNPWEA